MKKLIAMLLVLTMVLSFAACAKQDTVTPTVADVAITTAAADPTPAAETEASAVSYTHLPQRQRFPDAMGFVRQNGQHDLPGGFQRSHGFDVIPRCTAIRAGVHHQRGKRRIQNQLRGFRAAQLQPQLGKIPVIMGQAGEHPAGFAQGAFSQMCIRDSPKTVRRTVCCGSVAAAALSSPKTEIIRTCLSPRTGSDHSSLVRVFL